MKSTSRRPPHTVRVPFADWLRLCDSLPCFPDACIDTVVGTVVKRMVQLRVAERRLYREGVAGGSLRSKKKGNR